MDDIVGIISQFAKYLTQLITYLKSFLESLTKKEGTEDTTAAEEGTTV